MLKNEKEKISVDEKEEMLEIALLLKNLSKTEKDRVRYVIQGMSMKDEVVSAKAVGM